LGFALIAYGLQFLFSSVRALKNLPGIFDSDLEISFFAYLLLPFDSMFYPLWIFIISIVSGIVIISSKSSTRFMSLSFVFLTLGFFPLGTILSFYVLCYLFVINENKSEIKENLSEEI